jgi:hypothetical protein
MKNLILLLLFISSITYGKSENKKIKVFTFFHKQNKFIQFSESNHLPNTLDSNNKYDIDKIFKAVTNSVFSGKLKAFKNGKELSITEFNTILVSWDSTAQTEDPKRPGEFISDPVKIEIKSSDILQIRFYEKIELDTITYLLNKKNSYVSFFTRRMTEMGEEINSLSLLFEVKLNAEKKISCLEANWNAVFVNDTSQSDAEGIYNKEQIFSALIHSVLSGKLDAYASYPKKKITLKEFNNLLVRYDSLEMEDPNTPGATIRSVGKFSAIDYTDSNLIKVIEEIEFDAKTNSVIKKVSFITFFKDEFDESGNFKGKKKLFDIHLKNEITN